MSIIYFSPLKRIAASRSITVCISFRLVANSSSLTALECLDSEIHEINEVDMITKGKLWTICVLP